MIIGRGRRPATLWEAVRRAKAGDQKFDLAIREFLDTFYSEPERRAESVRRQPDRLDILKDAYVAAVAEHLCSMYSLDEPAWTEDHGNGLRRPFFAGGLASLRGTLLAESPTAFRKRLIFVSKNALHRPRMELDRETSAPGYVPAPSSQVGPSMHKQ